MIQATSHSHRTKEKQTENKAPFLQAVPCMVEFHLPNPDSMGSRDKAIQFRVFIFKGQYGWVVLVRSKISLGRLINDINIFRCRNCMNS